MGPVNAAFHIPVMSLARALTAQQQYEIVNPRNIDISPGCSTNLE